MFSGLCIGLASDHLTEEKIDWSRLDVFQDTMSREEFIHSLSSVYCPRQEWWAPWLEIKKAKLRVRISNQADHWYDLHFLDANHTNKKNKASSLPDKLSGLIIALDPGHIGGNWSVMEKRHFHKTGDQPVKEGDLALAVAQELKVKLESLGASVVMVRNHAEPVTSQRPVDYYEEAKNWAEEILSKQSTQSEEIKKMIRERSELLFYRVSEINARAVLINQSIKPDLVICIHFNAAPWKDVTKQELVERNDHHVLVNGCYMGGEIADHQQRFEFLWRLFHRWSYPEQGLAESIARAFSERVGLPPFSYKGYNALKVGDVPGVWARNLLANRKYYCPVVFLEPYVANSLSTYPRIQEWLADKKRKDGLISEYADVVLEGIKNYFNQ